MKIKTQATSLVVASNPSDVSHTLFQKASIPSQLAIGKKVVSPKLTFEPPSIGTINLIQQAALAAGGRKANSSTAASHFKAAQSKNAVHMGRVDLLPVACGHASKTSPLAKLLPRQSNIIQNKLAATSIPISDSTNNRSVPPNIPANGSRNVLSQAVASSPDKLPSLIAPPSYVAPPSISCKLPSASKRAKPLSAGKSKSKVNSLGKSKQKP